MNINKSESQRKRANTSNLLNGRFRFHVFCWFCFALFSSFSLVWHRAWQNGHINRFVIEVQNEIIINLFNGKVGDSSQIHRINQFRRVFFFVFHFRLARPAIIVVLLSPYDTPIKVFI